MWDDAEIATWGDRDLHRDDQEPSQQQLTIAFLSTLEAALTRTLETDRTPPERFGYPELKAFYQCHMERVLHDVTDAVRRIGVHRLGLELEPEPEVVDW